MKLHYYASSPNPFYSDIPHHHHGYGFGSIFARLFSKVAAKTVAKTVSSAAKVAGRKVLKVAAKQGVRAAKKIAEEGLKEARKIGTDLVTQGIDTLSQAAINRGVPADTVHNVSNVVREGAHRAVNQLSSAADKQIDKLAIQANNKINKPIIQPKSDITSQRKILYTPEISTKTPTRKRRRTAVRKRKSNLYTSVISPPKKVKYNLQNDIEES